MPRAVAVHKPWSSPTSRRPEPRGHRGPRKRRHRANAHARRTRTAQAHTRTPRHPTPRQAKQCRQRGHTHDMRGHARQNTLHKIISTHMNNGGPTRTGGTVKWQGRISNRRGCRVGKALTASRSGYWTAQTTQCISCPCDEAFTDTSYATHNVHSVHDDWWDARVGNALTSKPSRRHRDGCTRTSPN